MRTRLFLFCCLVVGSGCQTKQVCDDVLPTADGDLTCSFAGYDDREVDLYFPADADTALPVVFFLHGGAGTGSGVITLPCGGGDRDSSSCIDNLGDAEGFLTVVPEGTANAVLGRSWNGGGGVGDYVCVGGVACAENVDDVAYFETMIDALIASGRVDARRIYAMGISQGAAMSYRIGCRLGDKIAAIAPVAGAYQSLANGEECVGSTSVLHMHGSADPIWPPEGGPSEGEGSLLGVSVAQSIVGDDQFEGWATRLGCSQPPNQDIIEDSTADGVSSRVDIYTGCRDGAEVRVIMSEGAGHTWPGGRQYLSEDDIGLTTTDFAATTTAWAFFERFSLPGS